MNAIKPTTDSQPGVPSMTPTYLDSPRKVLGEHKGISFPFEKRHISILEVSHFDMPLHVHEEYLELISQKVQYSP